MADEQTEPLNRNREAGLRLLLFIWGLVLFVIGGLVLGLRTWTLGTGSILSDGGVALGSSIIALGAFLWTFYLYLTSTDRGLRLLARLPPYRERLGKIK